MCSRCDKEVIESGILESDLPYLPYKPAHWYCMVPGCTCKTVGDYGIAPIYWWPVKITRKVINTHEWEYDGSWKGGRKEELWRGGWTNCLHGYICGKHFSEYKENSRLFMDKYCKDEKEMMERVKIKCK